jgi:branched-chain amino acid transport system substrate-binding protein
MTFLLSSGAMAETAKPLLRLHFWNAPVVKIYYEAIEPNQCLRNQAVPSKIRSLRNDSMANRAINLIAAAALTAIAQMSAQAEVLVATAGPMSGQYSWFGEQMQRGAELAVADLNAAGGVLGENIKLIVGDDACDPAQAVAVANRFVSDGVAFIAGHWCSSSSIPASKVYGDAGLLMITPASTNPKLTDEGARNVFRLSGRDDEQGIVAGSYLAEHWGDKKIAILHDGTTYGKGLADATREHLQKRGVQEALYEAYKPGEVDYFSVVSKMQDQDIDVFYVGGYSTEAALMIREARDRDYEIQLVSGDALTSAEFAMVAGPAADGTLITFFPDARQYPEAADVVARFRDDGYEPEGYTLQTYAAFQTWSQAAEKAGSLDLDKMIETLHQTEFQTVFGTFGFDDNGDMTAPGFVWYVWKEGEYVPVK